MTDAETTPTPAHAMGRAPMWRLLLQMAFPPTLAVIVMALYSIVDRAFVGNIVGVDALSGLSAAFPAQMMAVGLGLLTGLGGMSVASRALGAGDARQASRVIGAALAILLPAYLLLAGAGLARLDAIIDLLGASADTAGYARQYLVIILPGSVFVMLTMTANNLFMAEGRPIAATAVLVGGAVANVMLDALFIVALGWGVAGAAAATVVAQGLAAGYAAYFYLSGRSALRITPDALRPRPALMRETLALGAPICIIEVARSVVVVVINNILSAYPGGDGYIALFGVINAALEFALAPFIGAALAYLPLAGYNYGARRYGAGAAGHLAELPGGNGGRGADGGGAAAAVGAHHRPVCGRRRPASGGRRRAAGGAAGAARGGDRVRQFHRVPGDGQGVAVGGADHYAAGDYAAGVGICAVGGFRGLGRLVVISGDGCQRDAAGRGSAGAGLAAGGALGGSRLRAAGGRRRRIAFINPPPSLRSLHMATVDEPDRRNYCPPAAGRSSRTMLARV